MPMLPASSALRPLLLIQMGEPPEDIKAVFGAQGQWLERALGHDFPDRVVCCPHAGDVLPSPDTVRGAIISGSWTMVTDREEWSERVGVWIRSAVASGTPLFGICYGHQLMADALGGQVAYLNNGPEVGTLPIVLNAVGREDALLRTYPVSFSAHLTHSQTVTVLPPGAVGLASSARDMHQIVRYGANAVSVQFHPEFTEDLMQACVLRRAKTQDTHATATIDTKTEAAPFAHRLLIDFLSNTASR